jgi:hypothetical protein
MTKFDSLKSHSGDQVRSNEFAPDTSIVGPDMSKLSMSENKSLMSSPMVSSGLHHLEIAAATIGTPTALGALGGGAFGLAAEGALQVYKYPLAASLGALGGTSMAADLLRTESQYISTAGKFGAKGAALGVAFGAAIFAGYETKKYFEK